MNVTRRRNPIQKGLKDYMVPLVGVILILILIFSLFSGGDNTPTKIDVENKVGLELQYDGASTESFIEYPGNYKKKVEGDAYLYKGEKLKVNEGSVNLNLLGLGSFKLNKLGEFKYLENGNFSLYSSDLWLNSISSVNVDMRFAYVKVGDNTNISFSQNEMGSTVYLLNGFAEVENLAGINTVLAKGQKLTVSRLDANNEDADLSLLKENIDDYYKQSDWFIKNNGTRFLESDDNNKDTNGTGTTSKIIKSNSNLITFNNLSDDSNVSSDSITVNGKFSEEEITKITLNGKEAGINSELKTFKFEDVLVSNKENDLVFKVYDDANDILSRFVYTVYYDGAVVSKSTGSGKFQVKTFDVDGTKFTFTSIKDSGVSKNLNGKVSYTTYGDYLTIYGKVLAEGITKVTVNGYTLNSYSSSLGTWRYHPSVVNNNLDLGTNVYEVKYYSEDGKIVYTNHFTLVKKDYVAPTTVKKEEEKNISDEAKID